MCIRDSDEAALENCFQEHGAQIAAVLVEGIQGVGGIHVALSLIHISEPTRPY